MKYRSVLFVPGHEEKKIKKAYKLNADLIVLDLESTVPDDQKEQAKKIIKECNVNKDQTIESYAHLKFDRFADITIRRSDKEKGLKNKPGLTFPNEIIPKIQSTDTEKSNLLNSKNSD